MRVSGQNAETLHCENGFGGAADRKPRAVDDPTNHLDLESISSLNDGLKNFKESIIFASHDHEFIQTLANHIIVLSKNGVIDRIDETYDEFLENEEVQAKVKELWSQ